MITATPFYAGLLGLLFVTLSLRVITTRRVARVNFGDGGDGLLLRRIRVQANFAEYVPLGLILMTLFELQDTSKWPIHLSGALLVAGRVIHAAGVGREPEITGSRTIGMGLTFGAVIIASLANCPQ